MQAIILAAGMGKRLGHLTSDNTKCMLRVHDKTLIERMLSHLQNLDLSQIVMVIGYKGENVKNFIGESFNGIPIKYVENPIYDKTNNIYSLYLAKEFLIEDDTLLLESDLIIEEQILHNLVNHPYPNLAVVAKYQSWMDGTVVSLDDQDNIISFIPKKSFSFKDVASYFKTVNIYKFSKGFSKSHYVPFLEAYSKALGNNEYYEQVLRVITLLEKPEIKALRLNGEKWYEIDDIQDLNNAEAIFAEPKDKLLNYQSRYGGYWRFPELLDFSNLLNPFFPTPILKSELKANIDVLQSAYPSGSAVHCLLAAKNFSINQNYVVVGNGTSELLSTYFNNHSFITGVVVPTSDKYSNITKKGKVIHFNPGNSSFSYTAEDLIDFFSETIIDQLVLINPDNPSGNYIPLSDLLVLLDWAKSRKVRIIIDESFVDFSIEGHLSSLLHDDILKKYPNLIVLKSMAIPYGIPGFNVGLAASSDEDIIASIKLQLPACNINSFSEYFMQVFGKYEKDYFSACSLLREERSRFYEELKKFSYLRVIPSQGIYFLCEVVNGLTAHKLTDLLLAKYNILINDCSEKKGLNKKNYVRIAVRNHSDNDKLLNALVEIAQMKIIKFETLS